jgi:WXG100 family type VII secretion target
MMSGIIRVTPAELVDMSKRYSNEGGELGLLIGRLDSMIGQLQGMWEGEASNAFRDQYEELKPSFVQMQNLVEDISRQLDKTAIALQEADANIAGQIRG